MIDNTKFWAEVNKANGDAKADVFRNLFLGLSFVAYDNGDIWNKDKKMIFVPGRKSNSVLYQKAKHHFRFGCDMNEVAKELCLEINENYLKN
jgi:hypothetical protein